MIWWTFVRPGLWQGFLFLQSQPCPPFSLPLGRGLADQQFNIAHIQRAAWQRLYKPQLHKNLQGSFYGADLLAGNGGNHLRGVGDIFIKLQLSAVFQRFQVQFQENVGIEDTVLHTFQQHDSVLVKVILFQLEVVVFSVV